MAFYGNEIMSDAHLSLRPSSFEPISENIKNENQLRNVSSACKTDAPTDLGGPYLPFDPFPVEKNDLVSGVTCAWRKIEKNSPALSDIRFLSF